MSGPTFAEIGGILRGLAEDEVAALKEELTPEKRQRLIKATGKYGELLAMRANGTEVDDLIDIVWSILLDYRAVAAVVMARGAERMATLGAKVLADLLLAAARRAAGPT